MDKKKKHNILREKVIQDFKQRDFSAFCPSKLIDNFWFKYRPIEGGINVFDLVGRVEHYTKVGDQNKLILDDFLQDFSEFLIASYAIHYMNHEVCTYRCFLSQTEANAFQAYMKRHLINNLPDTDPP